MAEQKMAALVKIDMNAKDVKRWLPNKSKTVLDSRVFEQSLGVEKWIRLLLIIYIFGKANVSGWIMDNEGWYWMSCFMKLTAEVDR